MLSKMSAYRRGFDETKHMSFLIAEYNKILYEVRNNIKKVFDSEPVYNEKYLRTKIKS